ncbi:hypothetical protein C6P45_000399 [Maudiozyma exigua]|uniref:E3 ubiquitin-protein ligase PEP5 n=1 Tax=Maudiozyma exigua TaxID=34358 RepID=A0A9P7BD96_MAUEX|nr:hypothetical protein C6P45_000399 [Kazachstania exigua]
MSFSSWMQFQFFENIPIRDPQLGTASQLYSDPTLSAATLINESRLLIAVNSSTIKVVDLANSQILNEFKAFDEGFRITYLKAINKLFIVAVAECSGVPAQFKLFRMEKLPKSSKSFQTLVELKNGDNTSPISAISIANDLSCFVVGYINGRIILVRGDIVRDRGAKQRVIFNDNTQEPITSVALNKDASFCYASTTSNILLFNTTGRNNNKPDLVLNNSSGLNLNCSSISVDMNDFVCYNKGNIELYHTNGEKRSVRVDLECVKRIYAIDKDKVLFVTEEKPLRESSLQINALDKTAMSRIVVLDLKAKLVALDFILPNSVIDILGTPDEINSPIFLLSTNGILHKISEKSLNDRLSIVIQKQLYPFAIELATASNISDLDIQGIHKKFGDFLYKKGQKAEAVEQYVQCLDVVETSEIIAKFSVEGTADLNGIKNLSDYLWSLIKKGIASSDHVTLLLLVLIKLKDKDQINFFLTHFSRLGTYSEDVIKADIDEETYYYSGKDLFNFKLVLHLLDESNFKEEAYKLAVTFSKDAVTIVDVLLNIMDSPMTAINYIRSLAIDDTLRVLALFSKTLLDVLPNDTIVLLIEVFTGKYVSQKYEYNTVGKKEKENKPNFRKIFYSYTSFIDYMNNPPFSKSEAADDETENKEPTYHPPKPSIVFSSFLDKPFQFVVFLEACLDSYQRYEGFNEDKQIIFTTLYELYLRLAEDDTIERKSEWRNKAKNILSESNKLVSESCDENSLSSNTKKPIDNSLMMLISHMNKVDTFLTYDDDNSDNLNDLIATKSSSITQDEGALISILNGFRSLTLTEEPNNCMRYFEKYATKDHNLYRAALTYFTSSKHVLNDVGGESIIKEKIIDKIVDKRLLTPIELIQILSGSNCASYGLIQDILMSNVRSQEQETSRAGKLIDSYEKELNDKKEKLNKLLKTEEGNTIALKGKTCNRCETAIELPIIYFKCGHLYHQRCLNEEDYTNNGKRIYRCPKCLVEHERSKNMYETQKGISSNQGILELALSDEHKNDDRFKIITEFIGRGGLEYAHINL